jgi:CheY-like chemotaxis protein
VRVNLNQEVEDAKRILERSIPKMIALELKLAREPWPLFADPVQIEQVLLNLVTNAVAAMPDGGKLMIETSNIVLDEDFVRVHSGSSAGQHVLLTVTDTGCGMDREVLDHIFDPFYTTKELGKGTGLGLASVYGIVQAHGGYIHCYSEPGLGTTFRIFWPAVDKEDACPVSKPQEHALHGGSETILVVDDEPEIRELTQEALEALGYTVKNAANGEEALTVFQDHGRDIALVLLDLNMPGMGGYKCLQELLALDPAVKVVISSGYTANGHGKGVESSGAMGFISKPYQLKELAVMMRKVIDAELDDGQRPK